MEKYGRFDKQTDVTWDVCMPAACLLQHFCVGCSAAVLVGKLWMLSFTIVIKNNLSVTYSFKSEPREFEGRSKSSYRAVFNKVS